MEYNSDTVCCAIWKAGANTLARFSAVKGCRAEALTNINRLLMLDLFIGYGPKVGEKPVTVVWVYDVAEGRAVKTYKLDWPLESCVSGGKNGAVYGAWRAG